MLMFFGFYSIICKDISSRSNARTSNVTRRVLFRQAPHPSPLPASGERGPIRTFRTAAPSHLRRQRIARQDVGFRHVAVVAGVLLGGEAQRLVVPGIALALG